MDRILIDASSTLAWLFNEDDQGPKLTPVLQNHELVAPWLWRLEVVNVVLVRERRKLMTQAQGTQSLGVLESLDVEVLGEPGHRSLTGLAQTARPHQLSAYDAVYLDFAVSLDLPLLTNDKNLREAAKRVGVALVEG